MAVTETNAIVNRYLAGQSNQHRTGLLRLALRIDAAATGVVGALLLLAGPVLDDRLGASTSFLWPVALVMIAWAPSLWRIAAPPSISLPIVKAIIVINVLWVLASLLLAAADWASLTGLGTAIVLLQAAAVTLFAELQFFGLRRAAN